MIKTRFFLDQFLKSCFTHLKKNTFANWGEMRVDRANKRCDFWLQRVFDIGYICQIHFHWSDITIFLAKRGCRMVVLGFPWTSPDCCSGNITLWHNFLDEHIRGVTWWWGPEVDLHFNTLQYIVAMFLHQSSLNHKLRGYLGDTHIHSYSARTVFLQAPNIMQTDLESTEWNPGSKYHLHTLEQAQSGSARRVSCIYLLY